MNDPSWLKTIALRSESVPRRDAYHGWCCEACHDEYIETVSHTDVPLMRDMLRLVVDALEWQTNVACGVSKCGGEVGRAETEEATDAGKVALAAYKNGESPSQGEPR